MILRKSPYIKFINFKNGKYYYGNLLTHKFISLTSNQNDVIQSLDTYGYDMMDIKKQHAAGDIDYLMEHKFLVDENVLWKLNYITKIEIETSTYCNYKCEFCPVRYNKRARKNIDINLFHEILRQAKDYKYIKYVTLHAYNEPTVDKRFYDYADAIQRFNLKLELYTNGSGITKDMIEYLSKYISLHSVIINFPSIDQSTYEQMTGSATYEKVVSAIDTMMEAGIKLRLSVQGYDQDMQDIEFEMIHRRWPNIITVPHISFDRTGTLINQYAQNVMVHDQYLQGCRFVLEMVNVSVDGDMYLCCNDYRQSLKYGNLKNSDIKSILENEIASETRKKIWGGSSAEEDFICRKCILIK